MLTLGHERTIGPKPKIQMAGKDTKNLGHCSVRQQQYNTIANAQLYVAAAISCVIGKCGAIYTHSWAGYIIGEIANVNRVRTTENLTYLLPVKYNDSLAHRKQMDCTHHVNQYISLSKNFDFSATYAPINN